MTDTIQPPASNHLPPGTPPALNSLSDSPGTSAHNEVIPKPSSLPEVPTLGDPSTEGGYIALGKEDSHLNDGPTVEGDENVLEAIELSCSETSSECSELSGLDELADLLTSEAPSHVEPMEERTVSTTSHLATENGGSQSPLTNMPVPLTPESLRASLAPLEEALLAEEGGDISPEIQPRYSLRKRHRSSSLDMAASVDAKRRCSEETSITTDTNTVTTPSSPQIAEQLPSLELMPLSPTDSSIVNPLLPLLQPSTEDVCPSSPPPSCTLTPRSPDLVSAEADTASSDDSDSDMSLSEINTSLSPLPPSPVTHLSILSPLPLSPEPHNRCPVVEVISPLPFSPPHNRQISMPLSPLPPSPRNQPLSPLPQSPIPHSAQLAPPQFASTVPSGLKTPIPCVPPPPSSSPLPTSPRGDLCPSDFSPFHPPLPTTLESTAVTTDDPLPKENKGRTSQDSAAIQDTYRQTSSSKAEAVSIEELPPTVRGGSSPQTNGDQPISDSEKLSAQADPEGCEEGEITDDEGQEDGDLALKEMAPSERPAETELQTRTELPEISQGTPDVPGHGESEEGEITEEEDMPAVRFQTALVVKKDSQVSPAPSGVVGYSRQNKKCSKQKSESRQRRSSAQLGPQITTFDDLLSSVAGHSSGPSQPAPMAASKVPTSFTHTPEATPADSLPGYQLRSQERPLLSQFPMARSVQGSVRTNASQSDKPLLCREDPGSQEGASRVQLQQVRDGTKRGSEGVPRPLRTDVATGQWENQTPSSSPKSTDSDSQNPEESPISGPFPSCVRQPTPGPSSSLPPAQRQLMACLQCPLPLPAWLVSSMATVQRCKEQKQTQTSTELKKKKRGNRKSQEL